VGGKVVFLHAKIVRTMSLVPKLLTEFVGTFVFLSVIALSGPLGPLGPLAIGAILIAMVFMGGHVSGAHYNPAITLGLFLRRKIGADTLGAYWATQLVAGALAFVAGRLITGGTPGIHPGAGVGPAAALGVEVLFTTALVLVVLNVAASAATAGNSFYGLAIGLTVAAGAFVGGHISGGAFNPAVGFGATLAAGLFSHGSWGDLWLYVVGPLAGAGIAAAIHRGQQPITEEPAPRPIERAARRLRRR
jgi:aquaporin Z